jgi:hypothetical protein
VCKTTGSIGDDHVLRYLAPKRDCDACPAEEALKLQRPLPDGMLKIVTTGEKEDAVTHEAA